MAFAHAAIAQVLLRSWDEEFRGGITEVENFCWDVAGEERATANAEVAEVAEDAEVRRGVLWEKRFERLG